MEGESKEERGNEEEEERKGWLQMRKKIEWTGSKWKIGMEEKRKERKGKIRKLWVSAGIWLKELE